MQGSTLIEPHIHPGVATTASYLISGENGWNNIVAKPIATWLEKVVLRVVSITYVGISNTTQVQSTPVTLSFAGISVSQSNFTLMENSNTVITFMLSSAPSSPVVISFSSNVSSRVVVSPASFSFTPDDWSVRRLQVNALNNFIEEGDINVAISPIVTTEDSVYAKVNVEKRL
jgi:hypothetical protein